jgi:gliding motility-associated-like protein
VNPKTFSTINQTICQGISFLGRTTSGTYIDTLVGANSKGCDSIRTLVLTVNPKTFGSINQTICEGSSFFFNNIARSVSGAYLDTLVNLKGCDSILTLNLTVNPKTFGSINQTICEGSSFLFNNISRSVSGTYLDTLVNAKGCDSILTLNLTVNPKTFFTINQTICQDQSFLGRNTSGTYIDTLIGANSKGCDSIRTLNLTVNPKTFSTINQTICQGNSFLGRTTSGTYIDTLIGANSKGCDSIRTLKLIVNPTSTSKISQTICQGQTFLGKTISGIYIDTLKNANAFGCDSIRTLNLTVNPNSVLVIKDTFCSGDTFKGRYISGIYIDTLRGQATNGCDSMIVLDLAFIDNVISSLPSSLTACNPVEILELNNSYGLHKWYIDSLNLNPIDESEIINSSKSIYGIKYINKCKSPIKKLDLIINKGEIITDKPEYCEDDTILFNFKGDFDKLKWFNSDEKVFTKAQASIQEYYYVDFENNNKVCRIEKKINIKLKPAPPLVINPQTLEYLSTLEEVKVDGVNLLWYEDIQKKNNLQISTKIIHQKPYYVSQTINGCESDLTIIYVLIDVSKILESIYINNSMSPNQDGILDAFTIDNIQSIYKSNLQIVNRWGELVFDTKNYKNNWFGSYLKEGDSDQILPDGVYYYHFEFEIKDYPEIFKKSGYIYLKK